MIKPQSPLRQSGEQPTRPSKVLRGIADVEAGRVTPLKKLEREFRTNLAYQVALADTAKADSNNIYDRVTRALALGLIAALLQGCGGDAGPFPSDLRVASQMKGLALADLSYNIEVIPFDGKPIYRRSPHFRYIGFLWQDGRHVSWIGPNHDGIPVLHETIDGTLLSMMKLHQRMSIVAATLAGGGRIAFQQGGRDPERVELSYARIDGSGIVKTIDMQFGTREASWSPDGVKLVFENMGQIMIYDSVTQRSTRLSEGSDPDWSPDGKWIAYRAPGNGSMLISVETGQSKRLFDGRPIEPFSLKWSPDGSYISFVERTSFRIPFLTAYYRLVARRMKDGAMFEVRKFGGGYGTGRFRWLYDYERFCHSCQVFDGS